MGLAGYVVDAVLLEGRSAREVAAAHGISKSWIYVLIERYRAGGYEALEPRSRRPRSCAHRDPAEVGASDPDAAPGARRQGHDAGAATISHHLAKGMDAGPVQGDDLADPQTRGADRAPATEATAQLADPLPGGSAERDVADRHHPLAARRRRARRDPQRDRRPLAAVPGLRRLPHAKARDVVDSFHKAVSCTDYPASLLSDNGAVFTGTVPPRQGAAANRDRAARDRLQELTALPPPDLRQDRAPTPDAQALPRQATRRSTPHRATTPARHVRPLLQPHPPPQGARRPHTAPGLQHPHQGQARQRTPQTPPTSGSAKTRSTPPARSACATSAALQNRPRQSPQRPPSQAPHRRPRDPRHRPRTANSSASSHSTPPATTSPSHDPKLSSISRDMRPACPETQQDGRGGIRTLVGGISPETVFEILNYPPVF